MELASRYDDDQLPEQSGVAYNDVWGYAYPDGKEIAIIGTLDSIWIYDVTDPYNIRRVFSFKGGYRTIWREFKTYQHYLYAITDAANEGLTVFDLKSSPDSITMVFRDQSNVLTSHMLFIDTATAHLYIAGGRDSSGPVDLIMFDLQGDPVKPRLIRKIDLPGNYVHDLFVRNDTAYCSHGFSGFYIYKIEPTGSFMELSSIEIYPQQGYNHSSWLHENGRYLVWADETHNTSLKMVDVSDRLNPRVVKLFRSALEAPDDTASMAHNPYFKGDYAYVSYYHDGVVVFNCSDPLNPEIIAYYDTEPSNTNYNQNYAGSWGVYPYLPSGSILASDIQNGLFVLYLDFQLSICEPEFQLRRKNKDAELNWSFHEFDCFDDLTVLRAVENSPMQERYRPSSRKKTEVLFDPVSEHYDYYYQLRWIQNDNIRYSDVKKLPKSKNCVEFQISNRQLTSACPRSFIRNAELKSLDGKLIASWHEPLLPIQLPDEVPEGMYLLEITNYSGSSTYIRILN